MAYRSQPTPPSPYAGLTTCLRCDRIFKSWDRRQNRLCQRCREAMDRDPSEERVYQPLKPGHTSKNE